MLSFLLFSKNIINLINSTLLQSLILNDINNNCYFSIEMSTQIRKFSHTVQNQSNSHQNAQAINGIVKQFVISTIGMVRSNIHEEKDIIDSMITMLQTKMTKISEKKNDVQLHKQQKVSFSKEDLRALQSAVEKLNRQSEVLSERLFDLNQAFIQRKMGQFQEQRKMLQYSFEIKYSKAKQQFETQKLSLQSELRQARQKCQILEQCLDAREQFIKQQIDKQDQRKVTELSKYLKVIEEIYGQIELLKNVGSQISLTQSEFPNEANYYPRPIADNYSQKYYNNRRDQRQTQADSYQYRLNSPSHYTHEDYYAAERRNYPQHTDRYTDRKSSSKNKIIQSRIPQIPSSRQNYYLKTQLQRRQRSRSSDKQKRNKRQSAYKVKPVILHFQAPSLKSQPLRQSEQLTRRSLKIDSQNDHRRIQQKNSIMQQVQQKLHGLKRKLQRQLKSMKK